MSESLLEALKEQAEAGRREEVLETFDRLESAFAEDRATTDREDVVATVVRYNSKQGSAATSAAQDFTTAATHLEQARIELYDAILGYLAEETTSGTLADRVDETLAAYEEYDEKRQSLQNQTDDVRVGVVLYLAEIDQVRVPKGRVVGAGTTLESVGDEAPTALDVTVTDAAAVTTAVSPEEVESLSPGEEVVIGVSIEGDSTGSGRVRLAVENDDVRESVGFRFEVLDKSDYLSEVLDITDRLLTDLKGREDERGKGNAGNGLENRLTEIRATLEDLLERLEAGNYKRTAINNRIGSVANRFESIENSVERGNNDRFAPLVAREYVTLAENAIDLLEESQDASM